MSTWGGFPYGVVSALAHRSKTWWYNRSSSTEKDPRHLTLALQSEAGPRLPYLCGTSLSGLAELIAGCNHQFHR